MTDSASPEEGLPGHGTSQWPGHEVSEQPGTHAPADLDATPMSTTAPWFSVAATAGVRVELRPTHIREPLVCGATGQTVPRLQAAEGRDGGGRMWGMIPGPARGDPGGSAPVNFRRNPMTGNPRREADERARCRHETNRFRTAG